MMKFLLVLGLLAVSTQSFSYEKYRCEHAAKDWSSWVFINEDAIQIDSNTSEVILTGPEIIGKKVYFTVEVTDQALRIKSTYDLFLLDENKCDWGTIKRIKHVRY